jgi:hypothetical protein
MLTVTLASVGNPDFGQNPSRPLPGVRNVKRPALSVKHASAVCRDWIEENGIGGGNWAGGEVRDEKDAFVARISYNGRAWNEDDTPYQPR